MVSAKLAVIADFCTRLMSNKSIELICNALYLSLWCSVCLTHLHEKMSRMNAAYSQQKIDNEIDKNNSSCEVFFWGF